MVPSTNHHPSRGNRNAQHQDPHRHHRSRRRKQPRPHGRAPRRLAGPVLPLLRGRAMRDPHQLSRRAASALAPASAASSARPRTSSATTTNGRSSKASARLAAKTQPKTSKATKPPSCAHNKKPSNTAVTTPPPDPRPQPIAVGNAPAHAGAFCCPDAVETSIPRARLSPCPRLPRSQRLTQPRFQRAAAIRSRP
jgi:hypothetical protein